MLLYHTRHGGLTNKRLWRPADEAPFRHEYFAEVVRSVFIGGAQVDSLERYWLVLASSHQAITNGLSNMNETMVDAKVTYTLQHMGKLYVIEHVPARICQETGEEFFAPETVEHIHEIISSNRKPDRVVETPVFEYV